MKICDTFVPQSMADHNKICTCHESDTSILGGHSRNRKTGPVQRRKVNQFIALNYFPPYHGIVNTDHIQWIKAGVPVKTSNTLWISIDAFRCFEAYRLNINCLETKYNGCTNCIIEWISTSGYQRVAAKWWSFLKYTLLCRTWEGTCQ